MGRQIMQLGISFDRGLNDKMCVWISFLQWEILFQMPRHSNTNGRALAIHSVSIFSNLIFQNDGWMNLSVVKSNSVTNKCFIYIVNDPFKPRRSLRNLSNPNVYINFLSYFCKTIGNRARILALR